VALGRVFEEPPIYFFLGDFSWAEDKSRQAALMLPLSSLPLDATTFTIGDSMSVAKQSGRRVYTLCEVATLFANGDAVAGFGFSDRHGFQTSFIEAQVWNRAAILMRVGAAER